MTLGMFSRILESREPSLLPVLVVATLHVTEVSLRQMRRFDPNADFT